MKEASQPFVKLRSTGAPATGHLAAHGAEKDFCEVQRTVFFIVQHDANLTVGLTSVILS